MSGAQSSWLLLQPHDLHGWSREPIVQWTHEALKEGRLVGLVHFLLHQASLCWLLGWERLCDLVPAPKKLGLEGCLLEEADNSETDGERCERVQGDQGKWTFQLRTTRTGM